MPESDPSAAGPLVPFDPLTEDGAAELRRRIERATVRRVDRAELDGHVGLSSRELYELGATVAPVGLRGVPSAVGGRLLVVVGAVLGTLLLAMTVSLLVDPLFGVLFGDEVRRDTVDRSVAAGVGLAAVFALPGWGALVLARAGARRVRAGLEDRRRSIVDRATPAADDPEARATVAVIREPGALRVSLLWVRGDPEDAALVQLRTVVEERVSEDDPGRAEDAVSRLAEVALRADAGRTVPWAGRRSSRRSGDGASDRADKRGRRDTRGRADMQARRDAGGRGGAEGQVDASDRADAVGRADAGGRADRRLVAAARAALPPVDPREPVGPHWDPEPLTDAGRAEVAARLVRARPLLWNAGTLDALAADPRSLRPREPRPWPGDRKRRESLPTRLPESQRRVIGWAAWLAFLVCVVVLGGVDRADDPGANRVIGTVALTVAVVLAGNLWWWRHHGPGRRLLRSVRAAARVPGRGLERGVPGPGGRILVLHGRTSDGRDRVELAHVRAVPGEERGRLQVRTLAWRAVPPDGVERPHEVAQQFWVIADDAGFVTGRAERDAGTLRRINAALGRAVAARRPAELVREPLAWAAALLALVSVLLAVALVAVEPTGRSGLALDLALRCWPLAAAVVLWRAARRVHDPVEG